MLSDDYREDCNNIRWQAKYFDEKKNLGKKRRTKKFILRDWDIKKDVKHV